jgi:Ca2+-binding EF-hand superfamily protein
MHARLIASAAALLLVAVLPADAQPRGRARGHAQRDVPIRFQEMDKNNDRVIARSEWQGSEQSFRLHDWDGDGVLSGDEVRLGTWRAQRDANDQDFDEANREYRFDDWTARGFASLDHDRNGVIARDEWHFDRESFRRADHNGDGAISRSEFLASDMMDDDRGERFVDLDSDRDGRLSRAEWHGTARLFDTLDANRDGVVTRAEMVGAELPPELFSSVDINRDGAIAFNEWHWSRAAFDRRDLNRDGRITREEFGGSGAVGTAGSHSAAYNAGYERGAEEGRAQAREDRVRNQGYDAEGQRELETADSGYDARFGPKADYQAGYRAGWRRGYPEGWRQP